jgi:hypothetical protein
MASKCDKQFAAQVPVFFVEIQRIFTATEIRSCLEHLERTKYLAPFDPDLEINDRGRRNRR